MYFLTNSILRTLYPPFENEFLEIALSITKLNFYFQKGRFSHIENVKIFGLEQYFKARKKVK